MPDGYWDDNPEGGVPLSIGWERPADDFDLYVSYDDRGKQVASSAGTADRGGHGDPAGVGHLPRARGAVRRARQLLHRHRLSARDHGRRGPHVVLGRCRQLHHRRRAADRAGRLPEGRSAPAPGRPLGLAQRSGRHRHRAPATRAPAAHLVLRRGRLLRHPVPEAVLRVYKSRCGSAAPARTTAPRIWREDKPLRWSTGGMRQSLTRGADEQFFGGGEQNGSFAPRPDDVRGEQLRLERGRLQQLPALLPLQRGLRRLPQHLRAGRVHLRGAGDDRTRNGAWTPTTSSATPSR
ncbi:hypothetical protein LT493_44710 [Streptomyces tricolor]|nr:hypothetical protein [Streptomyces tricolor]